MTQDHPRQEVVSWHEKRLVLYPTLCKCNASRRGFSAHINRGIFKVESDTVVPGTYCFLSADRYSMSSDIPISIVGCVCVKAQGPAGELGSTAGARNEAVVHHIPAKIGYDGPAKVNAYFCPEKSDATGSTSLCALVFRCSLQRTCVCTARLFSDCSGLLGGIYFARPRCVDARTGGHRYSTQRVCCMLPCR